MRQPLTIAERRHRSQHIRGQRAAQQILREFVALARIPHLFEIRGMARVRQRMARLAQKQRVVDGEGLVEKREQQKRCQDNRGRGKAPGHPRSLAR